MGKEKGRMSSGIIIQTERICQLKGICYESRFTGVKDVEVGAKKYNSLKIRWFNFSHANFYRLPCQEQILNMSLITETTTPMKDDYDFLFSFFCLQWTDDSACGNVLLLLLLYFSFLKSSFVNSQHCRVSHFYHTQKRNESRTNSDPLLIGLIIIFMTNWLISPENVALLFPTWSGLLALLHPSCHNAP